MKKILIGIVMCGGFVYAHGANMDLVEFYDADRTENEKRAVMAEELELFITSSATPTLIKEYQEAKMVLSETEKEEEQQSQEIVKVEQPIVAVQQTTQEVVVEDPEAGFFKRMFAKIGIGSTKKIVQVQESNNPNETSESQSKEVTDEK